MKTGDIKIATGYQASVETWIDTFGNSSSFTYDDDGFPLMPDYSELKRGGITFD